MLGGAGGTGLARSLRSRQPCVECALRAAKRQRGGAFLAECLIPGERPLTGVASPLRGQSVCHFCGHLSRHRTSSIPRRENRSSVTRLWMAPLEDSPFDCASYSSVTVLAEVPHMATQQSICSSHRHHHLHSVLHGYSPHYDDSHPSHPSECGDDALHDDVSALFERYGQLWLAETLVRCFR